MSKPIFDLVISKDSDGYNVNLSLGGIHWQIEGPIRGKQCAEMIVAELSRTCRRPGRDSRLHDIGFRLAAVLAEARKGESMPAAG